MSEESHQSKTTMKHIPNASPALKKAAKDIKPGVAGYRDRIDMLKAGGVKEEVDLDEAFINGREYASHGLMHPDHANMPIHKVSGNSIDFYAHGTGDKVQGKVVYHDEKQVHIRDSGGKKHVFKISKNLPKMNNEEEKSMLSYKDFIDQLNEIKMADLPKRTVKGSYGTSYQGDDDEEDDDKPAKPAGEKRGRGRPAGSGSGARQKGSGSGKSYGGFATHSLHLPNSK
jgi:hypothetical protein